MGLLTNQPNLANQHVKFFEAFAMHLATKIISHTVRTPRARTHQHAAAGMHTAAAGMHTAELNGRKLAPKNHASRARCARAGLTVYPPWIQIIDVFLFYQPLRY